MMKRRIRGVITLAILLSSGCSKAAKNKNDGHHLDAAGITSHSTVLLRAITNGSGNPDCDIDAEWINLRWKPAAGQNPDDVKWCTDHPGGAVFFVKFSSGPFQQDEFRVPNSTDPKCSDTGMLQAAPVNPPVIYKYTIHINAKDGPLCTDPNVVVK